ncbi:MAG: EAL domain-containing protein [Mycobacteriales bacterium]
MGDLSNWLETRCRRRLRVCWLVLVVTLVAYTVTTVPGVRSHAGYNGWIDGWLQNGILVAATLLIAVRAALARPERLAWASLAVGVGLYALGNATYFAWVQYQDPLPFPSVADAAWLTSYAFLYVGLVCLARGRLHLSQRTFWLDGIVGVLGFAAVGTVWLQFVLERTEGSAVAVATTMAYPISDLALLVVVVGTCALLGWRPGRVWLYLGAGLALFATADTIYTLRVAADNYVAGTMLDALWAVAAVVVAGASLQAPEGPRPVRSSGTSMVVTPAVCVIGALGLLVYGTQRQLSVASVVLATTTVVAALGRAAITFRDVQVLTVNRDQARTDELTGLGNRRRFYEALGQRLETLPQGQSAAVLLLDLDRFKEVNDALGHSIGDLLLRDVGARLAGQLRSGDELVRLGGDEFAMMLSTSTGREALALGERLRTALQEAFTIEGMTVYIDASIGIALCPDVSSSVEGLLQRADIAMYQAKNEGLGTVVYSADDDDLTLRLRSIDELRRAIDNDQLVLHCQPKVALRTGVVEGVEALVRWEHPVHGLLYPDAFIPDAERYGVMRRLTSRILALALDDVRRWRAEGGPRNVAVNISASNLLDTELPEQVRSMLELRDLPGEALTAEITKGTLMVDPGRSLRVLQRLRDLGVRISIDDYGTGYSSLARLRDMPVTELKLDKSFVQQMEQDERPVAIVASTIKLAHCLGLRLVAEGIESERTSQLLTDLGCDVGQGYYFGRPAPVPSVALLGLPRPSRPSDEWEAAAPERV